MTNLKYTIPYDNAVLIESNDYDKIFFNYINFKNLIKDQYRIAFSDATQQMDLHFINGFSRNNVLSKFNCTSILASTSSSDDEMQDEALDIITGAIEVEVVFGLFYESIVQFPVNFGNPVIKLIDAPSAIHFDKVSNSLRGRINFLSSKIIKVQHKDKTMIKVTVHPVVRDRDY